MKNIIACLLGLGAFLFGFAGPAAAEEINFSGTVNYVDYNNETVSAGVLPSGLIAAYTAPDELPITISPITEGSFSLQIENTQNEEVAFLVTGDFIEGIGDMAAVNCPYITVGNFDIDTLYFEIFSQRLVDHITDNYLAEESEDNTALLLVRLRNAEESPFISTYYQNNPISYNSEIYTAQDPILSADPTLFVGLIDEDIAANAALGLPAIVSVFADKPGFSVNTETVWLFPFLSEPVSTVSSISSLKWGAELTGTVFGDEDIPLESGYIELIDNDDTFRDGVEITVADNGDFSLTAPVAEDLHMFVRGPVNSGFVRINSQFFDVPNNISIDAGELEMITLSEVEAALENFNTSYGLDIGEEDFTGIALIGGSVDRLECSDTSCSWKAAGGVSVGITDSGGAPVEHYILYAHDDNLEKNDNTFNNDGGFAILILGNEEDFPLDVTFTADMSRPDAENFVYDEVVQARAYAYGSEAQGIVTAATIRVNYDMKQDVSLFFDDSDGGRCFISSAKR